MLTANQKKRYSRQIALAEIAQQGQAALLEASVLVVGAGGLGCPVLQILATAGVGRIGVVDGDRVELSNLHRQFLYRENDAGRMKAEVATQALLALNPEVNVTPYAKRLEADNVASIVAKYDLVLDGCDNFQTRFLVNQECIKQRKPFISGAVSEWQGQVAVFMGYENEQPCYQCFCPKEPPVNGRVDCSMGGVTGALTSMIGSHMAMEAIRLIAQTGGVEVAGKLMRYDALQARYHTSHIRKDEACAVCKTV